MPVELRNSCPHWYQHVQAIEIVEDVIPTHDRLIVAVNAACVGDVVVDLAKIVRRREVGKDLLADRADAALGNPVAGKWISDIGAVARSDVDLGDAGMAGEWIEDVGRHSAKALSVTKVHRGHIRHHRERHAFAPDLDAAEKEVLVLADRTTGGERYLIDIVLAAGLAGRIELRRVGVENTVANEFAGRKMETVCPSLDAGVHRAAAGASDRRVPGVRHHLELLHRVHIWRDVERACEADRRAVQGERRGAGLAAVHREIAVHVPPARPRIARGAEFLLGEQNTG